MASGDSLLILDAAQGLPASSGDVAALLRRNNHILAAFDAATDQSFDFACVMPEHYGGGGLTVTLIWAAASATANDCIWNAQIERHQDDTDDLDSDSFAAVQAVTATAASVAGELSYDDITFTDGAQMDSVVAGESFRLRVLRDADNGSDNMAGDAQLKAIHITET